MKTQTESTDKIIRVIVERAGICVINSLIDPPATREEIKAQKWSNGSQTVYFDTCGVALIDVY